MDIKLNPTNTFKSDIIHNKIFSSGVKYINNKKDINSSIKFISNMDLICSDNRFRTFEILDDGNKNLLKIKLNGLDCVMKTTKKSDKSYGQQCTELIDRFCKKYYNKEARQSARNARIESLNSDFLIRLNTLLNMKSIKDKTNMDKWNGLYI